MNKKQPIINQQISTGKKISIKALDFAKLPKKFTSGNYPGNAFLNLTKSFSSRGPKDKMSIYNKTKITNCFIKPITSRNKNQRAIKLNSNGQMTTLDFAGTRGGTAAGTMSGFPFNNNINNNNNMNRHIDNNTNSNYHNMNNINNMNFHHCIANSNNNNNNKNNVNNSTNKGISQHHNMNNNEMNNTNNNNNNNVSGNNINNINGIIYNNTHNINLNNNASKIGSISISPSTTSKIHQINSTMNNNIKHHIKTQIRPNSKTKQFTKPFTKVFTPSLYVSYNNSSSTYRHANKVDSTNPKKTFNIFSQISMSKSSSRNNSHRAGFINSSTCSVCVNSKDSINANGNNTNRVHFPMNNNNTIDKHSRKIFCNNSILKSSMSYHLSSKIFNNTLKNLGTNNKINDNNKGPSDNKTPNNNNSKPHKSGHQYNLNSNDNDLSTNSNNNNINNYNYINYRGINNENNNNNYNKDLNNSSGSNNYKKLGVKIKKKTFYPTKDPTDTNNKIYEYSASNISHEYINRNADLNFSDNNKPGNNEYNKSFINYYKSKQLEIKKLITLPFFKNFIKNYIFTNWQILTINNRKENKYKKLSIFLNEAIPNLYSKNIIKKYNSIKKEEKVWENFNVKNQNFNVDEYTKDDILISLYEKTLKTLKNLQFDSNYILNSVSLYIFELMILKLGDAFKNMKFILKYYYDNVKRAIIKKPSVTAIKDIILKINKLIERPNSNNVIAQEFILNNMKIISTLNLNKGKVKGIISKYLDIYKESNNNSINNSNKGSNNSGHNSNINQNDFNNLKLSLNYSNIINDFSPLQLKKVEGDLKQIINDLLNTKKRFYLSYINNVDFTILLYKIQYIKYDISEIEKKAAKIHIANNNVEEIKKYNEFMENKNKFNQDLQLASALIINSDDNNYNINDNNINSIVCYLERILIKYNIISNNENDSFESLFNNLDILKFTNKERKCIEMFHIKNLEKPINLNLIHFNLIYDKFKSIKESNNNSNDLFYYENFDILNMLISYKEELIDLLSQLKGTDHYDQCFNNFSNLFSKSELDIQKMKTNFLLRIKKEEFPNEGKLMTIEEYYKDLVEQFLRYDREENYNGNRNINNSNSKNNNSSNTNNNITNKFPYKITNSLEKLLFSSISYLKNNNNNNNLSSSGNNLSTNSLTSINNLNNNNLININLENPCMKSFNNYFNNRDPKLLDKINEELKSKIISDKNSVINLNSKNSGNNKENIMPYPRIYYLPDHVRQQIRSQNKITIIDINKYYSLVNPGQELEINSMMPKPQIIGIKVFNKQRKEFEILKLSSPVTILNSFDITQCNNNTNFFNAKTNYNNHNNNNKGLNDKFNNNNNNDSNKNCLSYLASIYKNIDKEIGKSLLNQLLHSLGTFSKMDFYKWVNSNFTQVSICTLCLIFTNEISNLLTEDENYNKNSESHSKTTENNLTNTNNNVKFNENKGNENNVVSKAPLKEYNLIISKYNQWLSQETPKIANNINKINISLTILNQINIIENLIKNDVYDINSFNWLKYIRHLWDKNKKDVIIECGGWANYQLKQLNTFKPRILLSPDTDKVFLFNSSCFREKSASIIKIINNKYKNDSYKQIFEEYCMLFWTSMKCIDVTVTNIDDLKRIFDVSTIDRTWIYIEGLDFFNDCKQLGENLKELSSNLSNSSLISSSSTANLSTSNLIFKNGYNGNYNNKSNDSNINNLIYFSKFIQTLQQEVILNDIKFNDGEKMFCLMSCLNVDKDIKFKCEYLKGSSRILNFIKPDIEFYLKTAISLYKNADIVKKDIKKYIEFLLKYESLIRNKLTNFYFDFDFYNEFLISSIEKHNNGSNNLSKYLYNNSKNDFNNKSGNDSNNFNDKIFAKFLEDYSSKFTMSIKNKTDDSTIINYFNKMDIYYDKERIDLFKFLSLHCNNYTVLREIELKGYGRHFMIKLFNDYYYSIYGKRYINNSINIIYKTNKIIGSNTEPNSNNNINIDADIFKTFVLPPPKGKKLIEKEFDKFIQKLKKNNINLSDEFKLSIIEFCHKVIEENTNNYTNNNSPNGVLYYKVLDNFSQWTNYLYNYYTFSSISNSSNNSNNTNSNSIKLKGDLSANINRLANENNKQNIIFNIIIESLIKSINFQPNAIKSLHSIANSMLNNELITVLYSFGLKNNNTNSYLYFDFEQNYFKLFDNDEDYFKNYQIYLQILLSNYKNLVNKYQKSSKNNKYDNSSKLDINNNINYTFIISEYFYNKCKFKSLFDNLNIIIADNIINLHELNKDNINININKNNNYINNLSCSSSKININSSNTNNNINKNNYVNLHIFIGFEESYETIISNPSYKTIYNSMIQSTNFPSLSFNKLSKNLKGKLVYLFSFINLNTLNSDEIQLLCNCLANNNNKININNINNPLKLFYIISKAFPHSAYNIKLEDNNFLKYYIKNDLLENSRLYINNELVIKSGNKNNEIYNSYNNSINCNNILSSNNVDFSNMTYNNSVCNNNEMSSMSRSTKSICNNQYDNSINSSGIKINTYFNKQSSLNNNLSNTNNNNNNNNNIYNINSKHRYLSRNKNGMNNNNSTNNGNYKNQSNNYNCSEYIKQHNSINAGILFSPNPSVLSGITRINNLPKKCLQTQVDYLNEFSNDTFCFSPNSNIKSANNNINISLNNNNLSCFSSPRKANSIRGTVISNSIQYALNDDNKIILDLSQKLIKINLIKDILSGQIALKRLCSSLLFKLGLEDFDDNNFNLEFTLTEEEIFKVSEMINDYYRMPSEGNFKEEYSNTTNDLKIFNQIFNYMNINLGNNNTINNNNNLNNNNNSNCKDKSQINNINNQLLTNDIFYCTILLIHILKHKPLNSTSLPYKCLTSLAPLFNNKTSKINEISLLINNTLTNYKLLITNKEELINSKYFYFNSIKLSDCLNENIYNSLLEKIYLSLSNHFLFSLLLTFEIMAKNFEMSLQEKNFVLKFLKKFYDFPCDNVIKYKYEGEHKEENIKIIRDNATNLLQFYENVTKSGDKDFINLLKKSIELCGANQNLNSINNEFNIYGSNKYSDMGGLPDNKGINLNSNNNPLFNKYFFTSNIKKISRDVDKLLYYIIFLPDQSSSIFKYLINKYLLKILNFGRFNVNVTLRKKTTKQNFCPITVKAFPSINITNFLCSLSAYFEIPFFIVRDNNIYNNVNKGKIDYGFKYLIDTNLIGLIKDGIKKGYWILICDKVDLSSFLKILFEIYGGDDGKGSFNNTGNNGTLKGYNNTGNNAGSNTNGNKGNKNTEGNLYSNNKNNNKNNKDNNNFHENFKLFFDEKLILSDCKKAIEDFTLIININNENVDDLEAAHDIWVNVLEEKMLTDSIMNATMKDVLEINDNTVSDKTNVLDYTINNNNENKTNILNNGSIISMKSVYNNTSFLNSNCNYNNTNKFSNMKLRDFRDGGTDLEGLTDWTFLNKI